MRTAGMSVAQRQLEQQNYVICAAVLVSSSIKTHDEQNCSEGKLFKRYILVSARNLFQHCTLMPVAHCRGSLISPAPVVSLKVIQEYASFY